MSERILKKIRLRLTKGIMLPYYPYWENQTLSIRVRDELLNIASDAYVMQLHRRDLVLHLLLLIKAFLQLSSFYWHVEPSESAIPIVNADHMSAHHMIRLLASNLSSFPICL